jgi:hypothetical protein
LLLLLAGGWSRSGCYGRINFHVGHDVFTVVAETKGMFSSLPSDLETAQVY